MVSPQPPPLKKMRRGWTTGACATAAAKAAYMGILQGGLPDEVTIQLPTQAATAKFAVAHGKIMIPGQIAQAAIIKDAGDDPDITHGVEILVTVKRLPPPSVTTQALSPGLNFMAGPGVGIVTRPGLALAVGEAAINPVPRRMITDEIYALALAHHDAEFPHLGVEISIPGGEILAAKTLNPRLGIMGGLSILGTTGIVIPYSCSAWIHSIQRGIDVARASGVTHIAGATGRESEAKIQALYQLPDLAIIDMGDFVGGMLSYLRHHPVPRVTIAGKFGKLVKLAQGHVDLHSSRSRVDLARLQGDVAKIGVNIAALAAAQSAAEFLALAGDRDNPESDAAKIAALVTNQARIEAQNRVDARSQIEVVMF
ncbi:MAG: cobalt-precorrin-5B (C(1))-methyltransferase [Candidatus Symbiobacter sp.]|nr:cobalt-precorrin-5B (C(1))-methyltransferase [Candidatus Symbiobacter sp.]